MAEVTIHHGLPWPAFPAVHGLLEDAPCWAAAGCDTGYLTTRRLSAILVSKPRMELLGLLDKVW